MPAIVPEGSCSLTTQQLIGQCLTFIQKFAGRKFYTFQKMIAYRIIQSVIDKDGAIITGLCARQSGKTEIVSKTIIGLCVILPFLADMFPGDRRLSRFREGFLVYIFGPIEEKALLPFNRARELVNSEHADKMMSAIKHKNVPLHITTNKHGFLKLSNGSLITAKSASDNTNNEGFTAHLVCLEECQDIKRSKIEKEIRPIMTNTFGTMVAIGTANAVNGIFKDLIIYNQKQYEEEGGKQNHFEYDWHVVVQNRQTMYDEEAALYEKNVKLGLPAVAPNEDHLSYNLSVQFEIKRLGGQDTSEFRMNYLLKWKEGGAGAIDRAKWAAGALTQIEFGRRVYPGTQVAALDVGKINDRSCCVVGDVDWNNPIIDPFYAGSDPSMGKYYRKAVTDCLFMKGNFESDGKHYQGQYERLFNFLLTKNVGVMVVDCTAIGDPVFERIRTLAGDRFHVEPFRFTSQSKLVLYKNYLLEIEAGRFFHAAGPITQMMPSFQDFDNQHYDLLKVVDADKETVSYEAPSGGFDDGPDAGAMMCLAVPLVQATIMPYIEQTSVPGISFGTVGTRGSSKNRAAVHGHSFFKKRRLHMTVVNPKTALKMDDFRTPALKVTSKKMIGHLLAPKFDLTVAANGTQSAVADHAGDLQAILLYSNAVGANMTFDVLVNGVSVLSGVFTHTAAMAAFTEISIPFLAKTIKPGDLIAVTRASFAGGATLVKVIFS